LEISREFQHQLWILLLTPKFGKESDLWVQLDEKSVRRKEGFFRRIRQKNLRSAICFRSARKLWSWFCGIIWWRGPSGKDEWMDKRSSLEIN
jgi:hypothetical protein